MDVLGIGNAIVDVLARADDDRIAASGLPKGGMTLIDQDRAESLYAEAGDTTERSGGSVANTVAVAAALGADAGYVGKVGDDELGRSFTASIRGHGVAFSTPALGEGPSTARCMVLVTPDGERTMGTFLGACTALGGGDVDAGSPGSASVTLLEGYLLDQDRAEDILGRAVEGVRGGGGKLALTLSDALCVERHRDRFRDLVASAVDILIADADEIAALVGDEPVESLLTRGGGRCEVVVVTHGAQGSTVHGPDGTEEIAVRAVDEVVDTTGAGDAYAGGFLYGYTRGLDLATCGRLGAVVSSEVVTRLGAQPPEGVRALVAAEVPAA